jgi:hypothetical protein
MRTLTLVALATVIGFAMPAAAQDKAKIDAYYGSYVGSAVTRNTGQYSLAIRNRDLDVTVAPAANGGFRMTSVVNARRGFIGGRVKRYTYDLTFVPGDKPNSWRATTSKPLAEGGPVILARLDRRGLHIYIAAFDKDGRLEVGVYTRKLVRAGMMELRYHRAVDGRTVRVVVGNLRPKKK